MEYSEFKSEIERVLGFLTGEIDYYKNSLVFYSALISFWKASNGEEILEYITEYFNDLIEDATIESTIISIIFSNTEQIESELTAFYFEDTDDYNLYVSLIKNIGNSAYKRICDAYPEINRLFNVVRHAPLYKNNYKGVKRKKYISEDQYTEYLEVLKK